MEKKIEFKLQGDGRDSWIITNIDDNGNIISKYMVYENPNISKGLAIIAFEQASDLEKEEIAKQLANKIKKYL